MSTGASPRPCVGRRIHTHAGLSPGGRAAPVWALTAEARSPGETAPRIGAQHQAASCSARPLVLSLAVALSPGPSALCHPPGPQLCTELCRRAGRSPFLLKPATRLPIPAWAGGLPTRLAGSWAGSISEPGRLQRAQS